MPPLIDTREPLSRSYFVGFVLALVLTFIPFGLVAFKLLPLVPTLSVIGALAIVQMIVHLHYFLHLDLRSRQRDRVLALVFTAIVVVIMAGGTIWIIFDLQYRMMT
jgi:cytochrome o ubiquinol oxidase operon protein cyoD